MSAEMKKMLKIVAIVFGLIFGWYGGKKLFFIWAISHYTPPAVTVSSSIAKETTWQSFVSAVGTITAVNGVDVSSEASGIVSDIRFTSGQTVKRGDTLVLLNTSVEQAQLKFDQAKLKLAQINYDRDTILIKKSVISNSTVDTDLAQLQEAQASVEGDQARINQKTIMAPFDGYIGIRQIDIGQYVSAGNAMVTLQSLDPLYVQFNLPEQNLPNLYLDEPVDITINLFGGKYISGKINAINSKVDQATRNILVQATVPNKDLQLRPGMFAMVKVWLRAKSNVIVLPETAISYSLHGDAVFIIKKEGEDRHGKPILNAYREYVKVGERRGDVVSILDGLKAGEEVVTSGQLKLQNGTHIEIDNSVQL